MQCAVVGGSREDDEQHTGPGESTLAHSIELEMKEYKRDGTSTDQSLEKQEQGNNLLENTVPVQVFSKHSTSIQTMTPWRVKNPSN